MLYREVVVGVWSEVEDVGVVEAESAGVIFWLGLQLISDIQTQHNNDDDDMGFTTGLVHLPIPIHKDNN